MGQILHRPETQGDVARNIINCDHSIDTSRSGKQSSNQNQFLCQSKLSYKAKQPKHEEESKLIVSNHKKKRITQHAIDLLQLSPPNQTHGH